MAPFCCFKLPWAPIATLAKSRDIRESSTKRTECRKQSSGRTCAAPWLWRRRPSGLRAQRRAAKHPLRILRLRWTWCSPSPHRRRVHNPGVLKLVERVLSVAHLRHPIRGPATRFRYPVCLISTPSYRCPFHTRTGCLPGFSIKYEPLRLLQGSVNFDIINPGVIDTISSLGSWMLTLKIELLADCRFST